jgi:hypothetical protein
MELCDHRRWRFCVVAPACLNLLGIVLLVPFAGAEEQASGEAAPMVSTGHPQETVKVVPTVNVGHSDFVKEVVFSPDGRWLVCGREHRPESQLGISQRIAERPSRFPPDD